VEIGPCGPVFGQLIVHAALKNTQVTTTITLYANLDRVDIRNEVEKLPTTEKQELDFAFPFHVPGRQYRFEAPGVIVTPGADQRPGAGQAVTAIRHFVDVFNDEFGVTLSQADSGLVEFGHRTTAEDPLEPDPNNSTVLALALENCIDWHEAVRDQAGVTHFVFRYSLRGHAGGFDPAAAVRFGWEDNNELLAVPLPAGEEGDGSAEPSGRASGRWLAEVLPADTHSFVQATPDNVVLTGVKVAEEDGLIARLWECAGQDVTVSVHTSGLGSLRAARQTDLLERDGEALTVADGQVTVPVRARGLATVRFLL
jgi:alpha-mannosidase